MLDLLNPMQLGVIYHCLLNSYEEMKQLGGNPCPYAEAACAVLDAIDANCGREDFNAQYDSRCKEIAAQIS